MVLQARSNHLRNTVNVVYMRPHLSCANMEYKNTHFDICDYLIPLQMPKFPTQMPKLPVLQLLMKNCYN